MSEVQTEAQAQETTEAQPEVATEVSEVKAEAPQEVSQEAEAKTDEASKYELKQPNESLLDDGALTRIAEYAKKRGLTNEQAQELVEFENQALQKFHQDQVEQLKTKSEQWKATLLQDKEFGGEAFKANAEIAKRAVQKFATPEFIKTLDETGLGNHPELVKMFYRIGKAMANDSFVKPSAQAATKKDIASVLYGET